MKEVTIRFGLFIAGWLCVSLGVIGIVLPVLPTTPFMLVAAACFSRSSPRFHNWLLNNRYIGPIISDWQNHKIIQSKKKRVALIAIIATFTFSVMVVQPLALKALLIVLALICLAIVAKLPTEKSIQK